MKSNPTMGFSLILQLTGSHGSRQFDRLTKTKTVEAILTSMDEAGIQSYIDYLLKQVAEEPPASVEYVEQIFHAIAECTKTEALIPLVSSHLAILVASQRGNRFPGREHAPRMDH